MSFLQRCKSSPQNFDKDSLANIAILIRLPARHAASARDEAHFALQRKDKA
jgi:hypothetical protein